MSLNLQFGFNVPRRLIFEALTDQTKVMQYTRAPAKVNSREQGEFSMLDGKISGRFLKLKKDQYIKMQWKFNDWEEYSVVEIILQDPEEDQCDMHLSHTHIPAKENKQKIETGWKQHILEPLSKILGYPIKD